MTGDRGRKLDRATLCRPLKPWHTLRWRHDCDKLMADRYDGSETASQVRGAPR